MVEPLAGYERRDFPSRLPSGLEISHPIYERGEGPPVVVIQELPGIGSETLDLAERLISAGYRVILPHLFGPVGRVSYAGNSIRVLCMRKELHLFTKNRSSPLVDWLRALCRDVRDRQQVAGVGVIGMCLTGNFAISLIADDSVLAAVASQPSLPFFGHDSLHMSEQEIRATKARLDEVGPMLALRFEGDRICRGAKFDAIGRAFNDDRKRVELETLPGKGHSVLTLDFSDEKGHPTRKALDKVLKYFELRLR